MSGQRKVVLFIAMSIDGYIAGKNDDLSFLSKVQIDGEDYGYSEFMKTVDTVVIGRKTYDTVRSFEGPFWHREKKCYVISRTRSGSDEYVEFFNGSPRELIRQLKFESGKDIYVDGGGQVVTALLQNNLIDRATISIVPHFLGSGVPLFGTFGTEIPMKLISSQSFPSGLVQIIYERG